MSQEKKLENMKIYLALGKMSSRDVFRSQCPMHRSSIFAPPPSPAAVPRAFFAEKISSEIRPDACYDRERGAPHFFSNTTPQFGSSRPLPNTDLDGKKKTALSRTKSPTWLKSTQQGEALAKKQKMVFEYYLFIFP